MLHKERNYFIGIVVVVVILLFFWSSNPPHLSIQPATNASPYLSPNKRSSLDVGQAEPQKSFHQEASETEHMKIGNGEEKTIEEDQSKKGFHQEGPDTGHMEIEHGEENRFEEEKDRDRKSRREDLDKEDGEEKTGMRSEEQDFHIDEEEEEWSLESKDEVKAIGTEGKSPKIGKPSKSLEKYEKARDEAHGKRYLIYTCNKQLKCSGFADRQRAIVGIYLLALATNRSFGLIMEIPAPIQDFYVPNKVNWDINPDDFVGKSTIDLDCLTKYSKCDFEDLNALYPQDIIYLRSKNDFLHILGRLGRYRYNLPDWVLGSRYLSFGQGWTTLMKPTALLRDDVNSLLLQVAEGMLQDMKIVPTIQETDSCIKACKEITLGKVQSQSITECLDLIDSVKKLDHRDRVNFLRYTCSVEAAIMPPLLETIRTATGYDYVELELVCAQIRLGKSSTLRAEPEMNKIKDIVHVWNVLRPYINKGHHMFLASDAQEVRDQAKEMFGSRVHINSDPIVHINKVGENQDAWQGMKTALLEQLILSTSCKVLVYSWSGFGKRSAMVRHFLTRGKEGFKTYEFYNGRVKYKDFDHNPQMLPKRDE